MISWFQDRAITAEGYDEAKFPSLWWPGSRGEDKCQKERDQGSDIDLKATPSSVSHPDASFYVYAPPIYGEAPKDNQGELHPNCYG